MPSLVQWSVRRDRSESVLTAGHSYGMKNLDVNRYIRYGEQDNGINLVWTNTLSREMFFRNEGSQGEPVAYGHWVAIAIADGGYLRYKVRSRGINLSWSDDPVYEWKLTGGTTGSTIPYQDNQFALLNQVESDHVVYCVRTYGINLRWADDCSTFDGTDEEARVGINYRIPLGGGGTEPSFGSVSFTGQLTDASGTGGATSFQRSDQWDAPPGSDSGLASVNVSGLRAGTWRIEARTPVWVASCSLNLDDGGNPSVNFQQLKNGCARGSSFPQVAGKARVRRAGDKHIQVDEHPRPVDAIKGLDSDRLDVSSSSAHIVAERRKREEGAT
jgi:hypothetical protein